MTRDSESDQLTQREADDLLAALDDDYKSRATERLATRCVNAGTWR